MGIVLVVLVIALLRKDTCKCSEFFILIKFKFIIRNIK